MALEANNAPSTTFSRFYDAVPLDLDSLFEEAMGLGVDQARTVLTKHIPLSEHKEEFQPFYKKLRGFPNLHKGWDGYDAEKPNLLVLGRTRKVLKRLEELNFVPTNISPSVEGGTSIYFIKGNKYADFEFFNSGEILGGIANREDEPIVLEIDLNDLDSSIERIQQFLND